ncbi:MAG TPA: maltose alpha-D-glucosyltransferase, partial [Polyangiaceae bacterium]|nr:maltose alpha-D-glucosyltransferase [Polyangiaceae bacterium]
MKRLPIRRNSGLPSDPLWFKDAVIYEVPIRGFADSDADGVGDIPGLISKLDYLEDLGVNAIWLLPFYPSPLRDGGYDISDYTSVHPMYGTLADFKRLLKEAHARGIRIITELVINHTSKDHVWFQRARQSPKGSKWRDFYVWSDDPNKFSDVRIIFKDFEASNWTWDPVARAYYWHRFYSHQPDLNFDNPAVVKAVFKILDFWLELGVDGLRLDAVPYLFEREGTTCENLPETHAFLKQLRAHVDARFRDKMLLAEANQWPEDAAAYFGDGDECHMNFHFPLMPRMFMAVQLEDRFPIVDILRQTPPIPENCQWATFLRNHDELTLEMVTDEDRDYMCRVYAEDPVARLNLGIRRRLAPLLRTREKIELMNGLLFSLPGTPVLYYGDEIGMGDNIYLGDRDGVRTPMQWSADLNAGFSTANPQRLYLPVITDPEYRYEAVNVQAQQANPASLLWWMKRIISLRKQSSALRHGTFELLHAQNPKVLAFLREHQEERVLVVANLSRFHQWVEIDLSRLEGLVPVEMWGLVRFPAIGNHPYRLSLAPHGFIWFRLERPRVSQGSMRPVGTLEIQESWLELVAPERRKELAWVLERYVSERRWFRSKTRTRKRSSIRDVIELRRGDRRHAIVLLEIEYTEGDPETYVVPLTFHPEPEAAEIAVHHPHALVAHLSGGTVGALFDGVASGGTLSSLIDVVRTRTPIRGEEGSLVGSQHRALKEVIAGSELTPRLGEVEQTNTTVSLDDRVLFKLFRLVEEGINSEVEIGQALTETRYEVRVARTLGSITYREAEGGGTSVLALLQEFVPNQGTAWEMTLTRLSRFAEDVLARPPAEPPQLPGVGLVAKSRQPASAEMHELAGGYLADVRQLGRRTAELHHALANVDNPAFVP